MLLIDATPLQSEHRLRGVGAYLRQLSKAIEALGEVKPHYLVSTIGLEHIGWQSALDVAFVTVVGLFIVLPHLWTA